MITYFLCVRKVGEKSGIAGLSTTEMKEAKEAQLSGFPNRAMSLVLWHVCMSAYTILVRRKGHPGLGPYTCTLPPTESFALLPPSAMDSRSLAEQEKDIKDLLRRAERTPVKTSALVSIAVDVLA